MELDEDDILRRKILTKDLAIKKAFKKYLAFLATLESSTLESSFDIVQNSYQSFIRELSMFEVGIQKSNVIADVNQNEVKYYDTQYKKREEEIENVKIEIQQLKERLAYEKIQRQYKEQYLALYKLINEKPTIEHTEKEIALVAKDLEEIQNQTNRTNEKLDLRAKQFQLLLHTVQELERSLSDSSNISSSGSGVGSGNTNSSSGGGSNTTEDKMDQSV